MRRVKRCSAQTSLSHRRQTPVTVELPLPKKRSKNYLKWHFRVCLGLRTRCASVPHGVAHLWFQSSSIAVCLLHTAKTSNTKWFKREHLFPRSKACRSDDGQMQREACTEDPRGRSMQRPERQVARTGRHTPRFFWLNLGVNP